MNQEKWAEVDGYFAGLLAPFDETLDAALQSSADAGLPSIQISPNQGKLLMLLAKMVGARSILEIGTLGGYSSIWLARALPAGGKLITLESESHHAKVARANIARAGLTGVIEIREGRALDTLARLATEGHGPFDLIFIDADKPSVPDYFSWAVKMSRTGSLIVVDNVVREGDVIDAENDDPSVVGIRRFFDALAADARVSATAIQTVGSKGYDGLAIALVIE